MPINHFSNSDDFSDIDDLSDNSSINKNPSTKNTLPPLKPKMAWGEKNSSTKSSYYQQIRKDRASIPDAKALHERIENKTKALPDVFDLEKFEQLKIKQETYRDDILKSRRKYNRIQKLELSDLETSSESSESSKESKKGFLPKI